MNQDDDLHNQIHVYLENMGFSQQYIHQALVKYELLYGKNYNIATLIDIILRLQKENANKIMANEAQEEMKSTQSHEMVQHPKANNKHENHAPYFNHQYNIPQPQQAYQQSHSHHNNHNLYQYTCRIRTT